MSLEEMKLYRVGRDFFSSKIRGQESEDCMRYTEIYRDEARSRSGSLPSDGAIFGEYKGFWSIVPTAISTRMLSRKKGRRERAANTLLSAAHPCYNGQLMAGGLAWSSLNANRPREAPRWTKPVSTLREPLPERIPYGNAGEVFWSIIRTLTLAPSLFNTVDLISNIASRFATLFLRSSRAFFYKIYISVQNSTRNKL
jgi:hypothetical protein